MSEDRYSFVTVTTFTELASVRNYAKLICMNNNYNLLQESKEMLEKMEGVTATLGDAMDESSIQKVLAG